MHELRSCIHTQPRHADNYRVKYQATHLADGAWAFQSILPRMAGSLSAAVGLTVLIVGWALSIHSWQVMAPHTALATFLAGVVLMPIRRSGGRGHGGPRRGVAARIGDADALRP